MSGQIILPNAVQRKPGMMYYIDSEGSIIETKLKRRTKNPKKKKESK